MYELGKSEYRSHLPYSATETEHPTTEYRETWTEAGTDTEDTCEKQSRIEGQCSTK